MSSFTDLAAIGGFVMGLMAAGAVGAWMLLRAKVPLPGVTAVVLGCVLSACSTPTESGGADPGAGAAADARETPRDRYVRRAYEQVDKKWALYRSRLGIDKVFWSLHVEFYVNQQGNVENIHVHNDAETNEDLTLFAVQAIQDANIPPMPAEVIAALKAKEEGRLKFGCIFYSTLEPEGQNPQRKRTYRGIDKTIAAQGMPQEHPTRRAKAPRGVSDMESGPAAPLFSLRVLQHAEIPLM